MGNNGILPPTPRAEHNGENSDRMISAKGVIEGVLIGGMVSEMGRGGDVCGNLSHVSSSRGFLVSQTTPES